MRLDLRDVILVPDAEKSFQCQVDLSDLEFYGRKPSCGLFWPRGAWSTTRALWS